MACTAFSAMASQTRARSRTCSRATEWTLHCVATASRTIPSGETRASTIATPCAGTSGYLGSGCFVARSTPLLEARDLLAVPDAVCGKLTLSMATAKPSPFCAADIVMRMGPRALATLPSMARGGLKVQSRAVRATIARYSSGTAVWMVWAATLPLASTTSSPSTRMVRTSSKSAVVANAGEAIRAARRGAQWAFMRRPVGDGGGLWSPRKPLAYETLRKRRWEITANTSFDPDRKAPSAVCLASVQLQGNAGRVTDLHCEQHPELQRPKLEQSYDHHNADETRELQKIGAQFGHDPNAECDDANDIDEDVKRNERNRQDSGPRGRDDHGDCSRDETGGNDERHDDFRWHV